MKVKLSKIDPLNIPDPLYRGMFYKEIRQPPQDWDRWEISVDETLRPELISLRYYGTDKLKMLVAVAAGLDDLRGELQPGQQIALPPTVWIRQRIRHYAGISPEDKTTVSREEVISITEPEAVYKPPETKTLRGMTTTTRPVKKPVSSLPDLARLIKSR